MTQPIENTPDLWRDDLPVKTGDRHKYDYGHALIYGAPKLTGATRLAASACARVGCGMVSVLSPKERADVYRASLPAHIVVRELGEEFHRNKVSALLYGPGGLSQNPDFGADIPTVMDADALKDLPSELPPHFALTPHMGEFSRCFPDLTGTPPEKAAEAAKQRGCIIVLKGAQTVIAAPNGSAFVNKHTSAWLATAGTGDVLAGMITGLLAMGMPPFKAACAAVWLHGEAAIKAGPHLVASDLEQILMNTHVFLNKN